MNEDKDEMAPINSDDDIEIRYQGLLDIYKDGRFTGDLADLRKLTVACFRLYHRVRSDPSQFNEDDLVLIIIDAFFATKWLATLMRQADLELKRAN